MSQPINLVVSEFKKTVFRDVHHLKRAFKKAALLVHPDKGGSHDAFGILNCVYEDGIVWFKQFNSSFAYTSASECPYHVVKGNAIVPTPVFMENRFPFLWVRKLIISADVHAYIQDKRFCNVNFVDLQAVADGILRLRAYYTAWLVKGATSNISSRHFMNSWRSILYLSERVCSLDPFNEFDPVDTELRTAFADIPFISSCDVQVIVSSCMGQFEKMFENDVHSDMSPPQKPSSQYIQELMKQARAEAERDVHAIIVTNGEQAHAIQKMERHITELKEANRQARADSKKGEIKLLHMEKTLNEHLDAISMEKQNAGSSSGCYPVGFGLDMSVYNIQDIEAEKQLLADAYTFFDGIDVDDDGNFSLRDAINAAYMLQYPDATHDQIQKSVKAALRTSLRQLASKRAADGKVKDQAAGGYRPYLAVVSLLLHRPDLTKFCDMIVSLATREIAPCPIRIAALLLHIKDISDGILNVNVAYNVLGLYSRSQKDTYLAATKILTGPGSACKQMVESKSVSRVCGARVMRGKNVCSYHNRKIKFALSSKR